MERARCDLIKRLNKYSEYCISQKMLDDLFYKMLLTTDENFKNKA